MPYVQGWGLRSWEGERVRWNMQVQHGRRCKLSRQPLGVCQTYTQNKALASFLLLGRGTSSQHPLGGWGLAQKKTIHDLRGSDWNRRGGGLLGGGVTTWV